ncbi:MAG: glutamate dehydrogenase, partial [Chloroflexi bacterium]|nr:glutamate dehydrogenase [Chloroflexota bacterium]
VPGVVTGKPVALGGSAGRAEATGRGLVYVLQEHLRETGGVTGKRIAVQGFGNVGSVTAKLIQQEGATVTHLSDRDIALYNPAGINALDAAAAQANGISLTEWNDATGHHEVIAPEDVLTGDVDVLVPAAIESVLTGEIAPRVRASIILEGANGPTTPAADAHFRERGITVIPDILANAGGVTVSYFEWVQGRQFLQWSEDEVNAHLRRIIAKAYREVTSRCPIGGEGCTQRQAANWIAIERVVEALTLRGIFP